MKKTLFKLLPLFVLILLPFSAVKAETLSNKLGGRILLQVESHGEAWYVNPTDLNRYYMANGNEAFQIMKTLGIGMSNKDIEKMKTNVNFRKQFIGKILLQVESHGEAYYISFNGRYNYLKDGAAAYNTMGSLGLGITNKDLGKIPLFQKSVEKINTNTHSSDITENQTVEPQSRFTTTKFQKRDEEKNSDTNSIGIKGNQTIEPQSIIASSNTPKTSNVTCATLNFSDWSPCSENGQQTRNILTALPTNCVYNNPILIRSCNFTPVIHTCSDWQYSDWSECSPSGRKYRSVINSFPSGCVEGSPEIEAACEKPITEVNVIDSASLSAKIDFATGFYPSVAVGDIDGDGKPDMVTANAKSNTISVSRNTSSNGSISFAARVDFIAESYPNSLTIADIDGDGKPDVIVANGGYTISVFRNTSSGGTISFAARSDYATQDNPLQFAVGDIDGDGKPDIVVANYSTDFISVFRNTSSGGNISFALRMDVALGARPHGIAIGDIDGDGKPDVLVASYVMFPYRNYISVLRNTGKSGAISFAAEVVLASSTQDFPTGVAISDIDGDGKPDIVVGNYYGYISLLRNTSLFGTISFASELDFSVAASYVVAVGDIDGDGKPDVITANFSGNTISVLKNTSDSGKISFAAKVDFVAGQAPNSIAISDIDGDGRMDVIVANTRSNTVSILRNQIAITPPDIPNITNAICADWQYSNWSKCSPSGIKYRSVINSFPSNCVGGSPEIEAACENHAPVIQICSDWQYSDWSECSPAGRKYRSVISSFPSGCMEGSPEIEAACENHAPVIQICSDWQYSDWSECSPAGRKYRSVINSFPSNCVEGSPEIEAACENEETSSRLIGKKININSQDDLKKIIVQNDEIIIFSQTACYASTNLKDWEMRSIPERDLTPVYSDGPFPVLFKGRLYIEGKDHLYYSDDAARNWIPVSKYGTAVAADENWLYIFSPYGSFRSSDGINFQPLVKLDILIYPVLRQPIMELRFAKAESGKIILNGSTGGNDRNYISYDAGLTWQPFLSDFYSVQDFSDGETVLSNRFGYDFIATGNIEIKQVGGIFNTLAKFKGDYYFAGETGRYYPDGGKEGRGIIIKNNNFDSALIYPETIRELEIVQGNLMAVGDKGAVYIFN